MTGKDTLWFDFSDQQWEEMLVHVLVFLGMMDSSCCFLQIDADSDTFHSTLMQMLMLAAFSDDPLRLWSVKPNYMLAVPEASLSVDGTSPAQPAQNPLVALTFQRNIHRKEKYLEAEPKALGVLYVCVCVCFLLRCQLIMFCNTMKCRLQHMFQHSSESLECLNRSTLRRWEAPTLLGLDFWSDCKTVEWNV